jgi:CheY-like chemotaxis protein
LILDDDFESIYHLEYYLEEECGLQVEVTAEKGLTERLKHERFDLVIIDMMIHPKSFDQEGNEVENVHFEDVNWRTTGLEFLNRLRRGDFYSEDGEGTHPDVPAIILSAVADFLVQEEMGEYASLIQSQTHIQEKPFKFEDIHGLIKELLSL